MADAVSIWTLFQQDTPEYLLAVGFSGLSGKGPLAVRISDRGGGFVEVIAANFAVQDAAANFETPNCLMLVPVGFLKRERSDFYRRRYATLGLNITPLMSYSLLSRSSTSSSSSCCPILSR